jgi:hypothetical protein
MLQYGYYAKHHQVLICFTFTASAGEFIDLDLGLNYSRASGVRNVERAKVIFNNNVGKEASSRKENINTLKL